MDGTVPVINDDDYSNESQEMEMEEKDETAKAPKESHFSLKFKKLSCALCEVVDDFGLVSFLPLNIQDKQVSEKYTHILIIYSYLIIAFSCRQWHEFCRPLTMPTDLG